MTIISWFTLICICALGAMTPGPSLAVIIQNRVQHNLSDALIASWAHATGIFFWALAACTALGTLFHRFPAIKNILILAGAAFLIYLAIQSFSIDRTEDKTKRTQLPAAWLSGLSISLLNPKVFVFFTALYSQFIPEGANHLTLLAMAIVAGIVDGVWYSTASLLIGPIGLEKILRRHTVLLNRISAGFYLFVAGLSLSQLSNILP